MLYDIIVFIFSSFWRWLGAVILASAIAQPFGKLINFKIATQKRGGSDAQRPDNRDT